MFNLKIRTKLLLIGIGISCAILLVIITTVFKQEQKMVEVGKEESLNLAYADLEHIVQNLYTLAESHQEVTQKNIVASLKVARNFVASSGGVNFSDEMVNWTAINQYTQNISKIELPKMFLGDEWFGQNFSLAEVTPLVDPIQDMLGVTCTVFQKMNSSGDMLRIATNVKKTNKDRAIGTYIPAIDPSGQPNPVINTILRGEIFRGRAFVVNKWYITAYEPIFDDQQDIIGVLYVGIPQENINSLRKAIMDTKVGQTGYVTVIDSSGEYVISPRGTHDGQNIRQIVDGEGVPYIQNRLDMANKLVGRESGIQQFTHKIGRLDHVVRDAKFVYFAPWDWIISAEADNSDFISGAERIADIGKESKYIVLFASVVVVALTSFLWVLISNSITRPIKQLVRVFESYAAGETSVRAEITSKDEIGYFADKFNLLLDKINLASEDLLKSQTEYKYFFDHLKQAISENNYSFRFTTEDGSFELVKSLNIILDELEIAENNVAYQNWIKTGEADLNALVSSQRDVAELCRTALNFIAMYCGAGIGVLSVKDNGRNIFNMKASYAFQGDTKPFKTGEGIGGQAALEKHMIVISEVPKDYLKISSSLGDALPDYIIAIPLIFEQDVKGVLELGKIGSFSEEGLKFVKLAARVLAVAINTAIFNQRLEHLLSQTKQQALQLEERQEELRAANEELEGQTVVLKKSESKLQLQQEELQASNEELEEKTEILEEQKTQIINKNSFLHQTQKQIEEKAKQLELATRYKSEFLANMSHELRTPLNSLLILASILHENDEGNLTKDQVESANAIYNGGKILLRLINDILDLSKIEARKIEITIEKTKLRSICNNSNSEFSHMAKDKGLSFVIEIEDNLPKTIFTDEHRLNQILRNLVGNAIKFTEAGEVKLSIARTPINTVFKRDDLQPENSFSFTVKDTGIGISKENISAIFEKFTQGDGSISRRHGGTGLGLSISRELAVLLGGELTAKSNPNEGSVFTLYLPEELAEDGVDGRATKVNLPEEKENLNIEPVNALVELEGANHNEVKKHTLFAVGEQEDDISFDTRTMLIIEDDKEFASVLAKFFDKNGYDSIIASDGESGIKLIAEHLPTAIILDIGLPGIDGWAILNELKANSATRHIPVHILSAFDDSRLGLERGAVGYLVKPVEKNDLHKVLAKIEGVLGADVRKLLIVEDDDSLRSTLLHILKNKDIEAKTAKSGKEAMELLRTQLYDCMVLDLGLADTRGFELLDQIQNDATLSGIPVIIFTGRDLTNDETDKLEEYSSSIILKNVATIDRLLDETALFMHRVEANIPEDQRKMIQNVRDRESVLAGKTVMVVDDDMRNALALNKFLKTKGLNVVVADNGQRAIDLLHAEHEKRPDIILMDIMMPVMDGFEAIKIIRESLSLKDIPILALTAKAMESDRQDCIAAGANDYLSKPVDIDKLLTMLRVWLYS
ncbi:MAG: Cache 3/Cache 2 fusion domain-containing protein [Desulfotalea sp.]